MTLTTRPEKTKATPKTPPMDKPGSEAHLVLTLKKRFFAPPELVFKAWTDPMHIVRWWGPEGFTIPNSKIDVRVGHEWFTCMRAPDGSEFKVQGVYKIIDAPEKLAFTWAWLGPDGKPGHETLVTVSFVRRGDSTELILVQEIFDSETARDNHNKGWSSSLVCLSAYLKTLKA